MELTALEQDLLGDLAEDDHALREIFEFVRLHHGSDPATVRRLGSELLATWNARGWLEIVDKLPDWPGYMAASMDEVLISSTRPRVLEWTFVARAPGFG